MNEKTNHINNILTFISVVLALLAIIISYNQQDTINKIQQKQFNLLQKEELSININPKINGKIHLTNYSLGNLGHVLHVPWKMIISNTGNKRLSIIDYSISRGESPNSIYYSGINGGIVSQKYEEILFPITLNPGDSQIFYIFVGITIPKKAYETLVSLDKNIPLTDEFASRMLAKKGIDYYGNHVKYQEYSKGSFLFSISNFEKAQRFWIKFTTGSGHIYKENAIQYQ